MILALLALIVAQAGTHNSGAVTGIVRSAAGAPAAGVRVYAQQVRDAADANSPAAPLEGQTQTDAAGRYRLELPVGRYYIGSGAVSWPTYYPGTTNLSEARTVVITAGGVVGGIDFASFVQATPLRSLAGGGVSISGTLSGTVRYSDGAPAPGVRVFAVPSSSASATAQAAFAIPYSPGGLTGPTGEYRIPAPADSYYIVAGFAEASSFHTGDPAATTPKSVTVTASSRIDNLDVEISRPPLPLKGTTVRGRVRTVDGNPVFDSTVFIARPPASSGPLGVSLPSAYAAKETHTAVDGTFEFTDVVPGFYNVRASSGPVHGYHSLEVANGPVTDLDFTLRIDGKTSRVAEVRISTRSAAGTRDLVKVMGTIVASGYRPQFVYLWGPGASSFFASLKLDGSFEFPGVPAGTYEVEIPGNAFTIERATITPTSDGVKLEVNAILGGSRAPAKIEVPKR